jgi:hypothetical protein
VYVCGCFLHSFLSPLFSAVVLSWSPCDRRKQDKKREKYGFFSFFAFVFLFVVLVTYDQGTYIHTNRESLLINDDSDSISSYSRRVTGAIGQNRRTARASRSLLGSAEEHETRERERRSSRSRVRHCTALIN